MAGKPLKSTCQNLSIHITGGRLLSFSLSVRMHTALLLLACTPARATTQRRPAAACIATAVAQKWLTTSAVGSVQAEKMAQEPAAVVPSSRRESDAI